MFNYNNIHIYIYIAFKKIKINIDICSLEQTTYILRQIIYILCFVTKRESRENSNKYS